MTAVQASASPVFPEWRDQPLEEILHRCRELVEDTDFPTVHRWRDGGGKVLGHFQVYFPEEIAHAAGLLPFKVRGAPVEADPGRLPLRFVPLLDHQDLARAGAVEAGAARAIRHPPDLRRGAQPGRRVGPQRPLPLPDPLPAAERELGLCGALPARRVRAGARLCEEIAGRPVTDDELRGSIALFNENRALLRQLYAMRRDRPWLVPVDEAYVLVALGGLMPREEHNDLLRTVLPLIERRQAARQDKIRVVLEGGFCEQPPLDLLRAIGRSCYVVDDDLLIGLRWIRRTSRPRATRSSPWRRPTSSARRTARCSTTSASRRRGCCSSAWSEAGAQAAILIAAKMCEPGLEEQVVHTRALDQAGSRTS